MSVRNHPSTARTSQCMNKKKGPEHTYCEAKFDYHAPSHTSGYPFEHVNHFEHLNHFEHPNHYPTATTAAGYEDLIRTAGSYLSPLNPINGAFNPAGKIMESTIGFDPKFRGTTSQEYISHGILELMKAGLNLIIAKKVLDVAVEMGYNLFNRYGEVDRAALIDLLKRMNPYKG